MENLTGETSSCKHANFSVESDVELPPWQTTYNSRRLKIGWRGRAVTALSQGPYRAYLYPVFTPAGVAATCEGPTDHPHHQSITIGTDHLHCSIPLPPLSFAHGQHAGLAVLPHPSAGRPPWHVSDWGSMSINPFLVAGRTVNRGEMLDVVIRVIAHDGDAQEAKIGDLFANMVAQNHH